MSYWSTGGTTGVWDYDRSGVAATTGSVGAGGVIGQSQSLALVASGATYVPVIIRGHWSASAEL